jgi:hypothetical protein
MSARVHRLAWLAPALSVLLGVAAIVLQALTPAERLPVEDRLDVPDVLFTLAFVAYAAIGALIAARHPRNPVGWLFCAGGVVLPANGLLWAYAMYGLVGTSSGLPAQEAAAWLFAWSSDPLLVLLVPLLLLFPNGRFLSSRWRIVGLTAVAVAFLWGIALALDPGPLHNFDTISNPLGIDAGPAVLGTTATICSVVLPGLIVAALGSVVVRYRRATATERQQIKWLAAAAGFGVLTALLLGGLILGVETERGAGEVITSILAFLAWGSIPVAAGIAILRHQLYDIDLVINRALVYAGLTATLAGAYVATVLLLQLLLNPVAERSDLAIAGSTLAVAALFRPARSRIQQAVDRRFYRRKYDAARTLESFGARLRDEVALESLSADLRSVVADTMQPAHVSLWLREGLPR